MKTLFPPSCLQGAFHHANTKGGELSLADVRAQPDPRATQTSEVSVPLQLGEQRGSEPTKRSAFWCEMNEQMQRVALKKEP